MNNQQRIIVHLTASPFFGGPERQMLGLALHLPSKYRSIFLCFAEHGLSQPFQEELQRHGLQAIELQHNWPHVLACIGEVADQLHKFKADVICCHGYKPDLLGWRAARKTRLPAVAVSRGWTWATAKVRLYEKADRWCLRRMDRVVCVSEGQAKKVRDAGVAPEQVKVIHNAIEMDRFKGPCPGRREFLLQLFPKAIGRIVCAAGRLSPEKGFDVLIDAAKMVVERDATVGFVLFGDGPLRLQLEQRVRDAGLRNHFIFAGFRNDVDQCLTGCDMLVQSSFTEGLPNVVLEASAASLPVVATAVGGTGEVIEEGVSGRLVQPHDAGALACKIIEILQDESQRKAMGAQGRRRVEEHFTFAAQSLQYQQLFEELVKPAAVAVSDTLPHLQGF